MSAETFEKVNISNGGDTNTTKEDGVKLQYKKSMFDREFQMLIKQSQEIIQARHVLALEMGKVIGEAVCLNKYYRIYQKMMAPEAHFEYFEKIYQRNRIAILNTLKDDSWLRDGKITVQFCEGKGEDLEVRCRQIRIMLSEIYLMACYLREEAEKALDISGSFGNSSDNKDLIRPSIMMLHLMRIFYHLQEDSDKKALGAIVQSYEEDLGVSKRTVGSEPWAKAEDPKTGAANGLAGLFNFATGLMEKMGYKAPPGLKPPNETEVTEVLTKVFTNEVTQSAIQGVFANLQNCNNVGEAVQSVVKSVTDPTTMEAIQGSVMETARLAADPTNPINTVNPIVKPTEESK